MLLGATLPARGGELVEMVRQLNAYQYQMVTGVENGRENVARQVDAIDKRLPSIPTDELQEDSASWAAAVYLLGGGATQSMRTLVDAGAFAQKNINLVSGSLAYAEGHSKDAEKLLGGLDAKLFPANLGGHLSLVQGGLLMKTDAIGARARFAYARLVTPDSLVEEAALRRELLTLDPATEFDNLLRLGRTYAAKYSKSPYARRFWEVLKSAAIGEALTVDASKLQRLEKILEAMDGASQFEMHLEIAKKAILNGRGRFRARGGRQGERLADNAAATQRVKNYREFLRRFWADRMKQSLNGRCQTLNSRSVRWRIR